VEHRGFASSGAAVRVIAALVFAGCGYLLVLRASDGVRTTDQLNRPAPPTAVARSDGFAPSDQAAGGLHQIRDDGLRPAGSKTTT
jgi:hypothetical protein